MALVRCNECGKPKGRTRKYIRSVEPIGYPKTALVCGTKNCTNAGLIWLEAHEWRDYTEKNRKIFEPPSRSVQFRAK